MMMLGLVATLLSLLSGAHAQTAIVARTGERVSLECHLPNDTNSENPPVLFVKGTSTVPISVGKYLFTANKKYEVSQTQESVTLTIDDVNKTAGGTYRCRMMSTGRIVESFRLVIVKELVLKPGDRATLTCDFGAKPLFWIGENPPYWSKATPQGDRPISGGNSDYERVMHSSGPRIYSTLTIPNVGDAQEGVYKCGAGSTLYDAYSVRVEGVEAGGPQEVMVQQGETATLVCDATTFEANRVIWVREGLPQGLELIAIGDIVLYAGGKYQTTTSMEGNQVILNINDARSANAGTYKCEVSNPGNAGGPTVLGTFNVGVKTD